MKAQVGFTLIELMIVLAIIGILATIAVPAYKSYAIRSKLSEAIIFAGACKVSVFLYYSETGTWPSNATNAGCGNVKTPNVVRDITVGPNGKITVGIYGTRTGLGTPCTISLTPANGLNWTGSTTCPAKYVPASFR